MSASLSVNDLIIRAFATLGIYAPYKTVSGTDTLTGLFHLNELLDYFQHNGLYIPFFTDINFTMTVGQDEYVISQDVAADVTSNPIIELDYVNIFYNDVSYPVEIVSYAQVDLNIRNTQVNSRPNRVVLQKNVDTSKVIFYQRPDLSYDCRIRGKIYLSNVLLQDDLSGIPGYYHRFMRYMLARELKDIYKSENWTPDQEQKYQEMLKEIKNAADFPLSIDKNPTFGTRTSVQDSRIGVTV